MKLVLNHRNEGGYTKANIAQRMIVGGKVVAKDNFEVDEKLLATASELGDGIQEDMCTRKGRVWLTAYANLLGSLQTFSSVPNLVPCSTGEADTKATLSIVMQNAGPIFDLVQYAQLVECPCSIGCVTKFEYLCASSIPPSKTKKFSGFA